MKAQKSTVVLVVTALVGAAAVGALAQAPAKKPAAPSAPAPSHRHGRGRGPEVGARPSRAAARLAGRRHRGRSSKAGSAFVMRAKFPDGYKVPPHWHPTDENVTVLSGSFLAGMGDTMNEATMKAFGPGGFVRLGKKNHHYATVKGETIIQIHATGPFEITYVNPNDDPRKKTTTAAK